MTSEKVSTEFIRTFEFREQQGEGHHLGLWERDTLCGGIVCWGIDADKKCTEVGYWLSKSYTGRGLATRGSLAHMKYLFSVREVNRVEMQCGVDNHASRAVAERCGLTLERIRKQSHWITDKYVDHAVYGIKREDFTHAKADKKD